MTRCFLAGTVDTLQAIVKDNNVEATRSVLTVQRAVHRLGTFEILTRTDSTGATLQTTAAATAPVVPDEPSGTYIYPEPRNSIGSRAGITNVL